MSQLCLTEAVEEEEEEGEDEGGGRRRAMGEASEEEMGLDEGLLVSPCFDS